MIGIRKNAPFLARYLEIKNPENNSYNLISLETRHNHAFISLNSLFAIGNNPSANQALSDLPSKG